MIIKKIDMKKVKFVSFENVLMRYFVLVLILLSLGKLVAQNKYTVVPLDTVRKWQTEASLKGLSYQSWLESKEYYNRSPLGEAGILNSSYIHHTNTYNSTIDQNVLIRRTNGKLDSLIASMGTFTVMTFSVVSANTATAATSGNYVGAGSYTITLPTGTWKILSIIMTSSTQTSSDLFRLHLFNGGSTNFAPAAGEATAPAVTASTGATEWKDSFVGSTSHHLALGTSAINYFFRYNTTTVYEGTGMYSGDLKILTTYGGSFTPATQNTYMYRIRMQRIF